MSQDLLNTSQIHAAVLKIHTKRLSELVRIYTALHSLTFGNLLQHTPDAASVQTIIGPLARNKQCCIIICPLIQILFEMIPGHLIQI